MPLASPSRSEPPLPASRPWRSSETSGMERNVALFLCLVLGFMGAHRFYLREPWAGVVCLLFCWTFVPFVLALKDAANIARMSPAEFRGTYGD